MQLASNGPAIRLTASKHLISRRPPDVIQAFSDGCVDDAIEDSEGLSLRGGERSKVGDEGLIQKQPVQFVFIQREVIRWQGSQS